MPINPDRLKKLQDLGLTEYQARVYLTLLDLGSATASQIPTLSRVPRTRIYVTMAQLHEKGLVNIIPERPLKYEPIPISEYLTRRVVELRDGAKNMEGNIETFSDEFSVLGDKEPEQKSRFEAIYGRRNFRDKLKEMYSAAEEDVFFIGTAKSALRLFNMLIPLLEDRKKDKVKFRFIFPVNPENREKVQEISKYAEVRHTYMNPLIDWTIVDSKDMAISHPVPNDENSYKGDDVTIWTNDVAMVSTRVITGKELWDDSIDPTKHDSGVIMLNTAIRWLKLKSFQLDRKLVATSIGKCMAGLIASQLKAKNVEEFIEELSKFWSFNNLGKIHLKKKRPPTLVVENLIDCQHQYDPKRPFCPFAQNFLRLVVNEKLGVDSKIGVNRCTSIGDKNCEFEIVLK